jgi:hypothetical protein
VGHEITLALFPHCWVLPRIYVIAALVFSQVEKKSSLTR